MLKPHHTPSNPGVNYTVQVHVYWGSLKRTTVQCGPHRLNSVIQGLVQDSKEPQPERVSYVVESRTYDSKKDAYRPWKLSGRYNHLGFEIAL